MNQLKEYYEILIEEAQKVNLTSITELEDVYIKHFYDCLLLSKSYNLNQDISLIDIGSGAGFPGLVLKIAFPNLNITLVEPTKKRTNFLELVAKKLNLEKITIINDRAENFIINNREKFDIVTSRAVANMNILLEISIPFIKKNGKMICLKGSNYKIELDGAKKALKILNTKVENVMEFKLPFNKGERSIIILEKLDNTNIKYPRMYSQIKKNPL